MTVLCFRFFNELVYSQNYFPDNFKYYPDNSLMMKRFLNERVGYLFNHTAQHFNDNKNIYSINIKHEIIGASNIFINEFELSADTDLYRGFEDRKYKLQFSAKSGFEFDKLIINGDDYFDNEVEILLDEDKTIEVIFNPVNDLENNLAINEIMFSDSLWTKDGDWVELINHSELQIDLSNWVLFVNDKSYEIPENVSIDPNSYIILANNLEHFKKRYPNEDIDVIELKFSLTSFEESIYLYDKNSNIQDFVHYNNSSEWPLDIEYHSIALTNPTLNNNSGENWGRSIQSGTPGEPNRFDLDTVVYSNNSEKLKIGPNPIKNKFNVYGDILNYSNIKIVDLTGRSIPFEKTVISDKTTEFKIDIINENYLFLLVEREGEKRILPTND